MMREPAVVLLSVLALAPAKGRAWDAATTHAGLTEQAALASRLGQALFSSHGVPLGLYEPLTLRGTGTREKQWLAALARVDRTEGFAPVDGRLPAIGWLVAGSVLEEVPAERVRNHYLTPASRSGLRQGGYFPGWGLRMADAGRGSGGLRGLFTGASFDGTGSASVDWLSDAGNDLGLPRFLEARERAATGRTRDERSAALIESLLVAGAILHLVEDAAEPALTRGDFRGEFAVPDESLRAWVARRYGRLAVPAPKRREAPSRLTDLIVAADGSGLADRTSRRFFSLGTLPEAGVGPSTPSVKAGPEAAGTQRDGNGLRQGTWRRKGDVVRWHLDEDCYGDYAAALLPEAGGAAIAALEHLFRGELIVEGEQVVVGATATGKGRLTILLEDGRGERKVALQRDVEPAASGGELARLPKTEGARRVVVVFRGVDGRGEALVAAAEAAVN